jgi:predicted nucleic acid-binding protein
MILYLDASALVKEYVEERGSDEVVGIVARAAMIGTALISRAEVAAALSKAVRMGVVEREEGFANLQAFRDEWFDFIRLDVTDELVARADEYAWQFGLRGYDAVHLAAASSWQNALGQRITLATFDRPLWDAAKQTGLTAYPPDLPALLAAWKAGPYDRTPSTNSTLQIHE